MTDSITLAATTAVILSLLVEWFPGVRAWWDGFTAPQKQGIMAASVAVLSVASVAYQCFGPAKICPADWGAALTDIFLVFLAAASAQQGVHLLTKRRA